MLVTNCHITPLYRKPALRLVLSFACLVPLCHRLNRRSLLLLVPIALSTRSACKAVLGGLRGLGGNLGVYREST